MTSSHNLESCTPGPISDLPSPTRGGRRMRESCTYGVVRGALSNECPLYVADRSANAHFAEQRGRTVSLLRPFGERARAVDCSASAALVRPWLAWCWPNCLDRMCC